MGEDPNVSSGTQVVEPDAGFKFWSAFRRQWRQSVAHYGLVRTSRETLAALGRAVLELTPSRRRARYGDLDYDLEQLVDTTRANVSFRTQLMAALAGNPYFATDPWLFEQMMNALPIRFQEFTFIDLGSGKGRALLLAAKHGFQRVIGVEFMPELHRAAEENIRTFVVKFRLPAQVQSLCMDALDFKFPAGPLVVYLFNPFPEPVLAAVLNNLRQSWERTPRPVYVAYRYLEVEHLLAGSNWLEKVAGTQQWAVYKNRRDRA
ncbi:MAG TPA: class I SAM-dependent methyltransferase [Candidatus Angelobacter sp.]